LRERGGFHLGRPLRRQVVIKDAGLATAQLRQPRCKPGGAFEYTRRGEEWHVCPGTVSGGVQSGSLALTAGSAPFGAVTLAFSSCYASAELSAPSGEVSTPLP